MVRLSICICSNGKSVVVIKRQSTAYPGLSATPHPHITDTDKYLGLVIVIFASNLSGKTVQEGECYKWTDRLYQVHYLPASLSYTVDKYQGHELSVSNQEGIAIMNPLLRFI